MRNIVIKSVDIAIIPNADNMMHLIVVSQDEVYVAEVPSFAVGEITRQLLLTLERPSLAHCPGTPASIHSTEEDWCIFNFIDQTKTFDPMEVLKQIPHN